MTPTSITSSRSITPKTGRVRTTRTEHAHPDAQPAVAESSIELAETGEQAMQGAGTRLRSRRYSSAYILSHNADALLGELAQASSGMRLCEPGDLLDLATRLFDDPSDAYAALDALSQHAELLPFGELFRQAQEQLCVLESPEWIVTGLDASLHAMMHAEASGLSAAELRNLYRTFVLSTQPSAAIFAQWVRLYHRARRRIVLTFVAETLASQIAIADPACTPGESEWLVRLLRDLQRLASGERDFVGVLHGAAARIARLRLPPGIDPDAPFSLMFAGVVAAQISADAMAQWVERLGARTPVARAVMVAAMHRAVHRMSDGLVDNPASREQMLLRFEALGETLAHEGRLEDRRLVCTEHA